MPDTIPRPQLLKIPEVAEVLRITPKALRGRIDRGTFPPELVIRLPGEKGSWSIRILEEEFYGWLLGLGHRSPIRPNL